MKKIIILLMEKRFEQNGGGLVVKTLAFYSVDRGSNISNFSTRFNNEIK